MFRNEGISAPALVQSVVNGVRRKLSSEPTLRSILSLLRIYVRSLLPFFPNESYEPNCDDIRFDSSFVRKSQRILIGLSLAFEILDKSRVLESSVDDLVFQRVSLFKLLANGHSWLFHGVPSYRVIADRPTTTSKYERTLAENFVLASPSGRVAFSLTTRAMPSHGNSAFTLEIFA